MEFLLVSDIHADEYNKFSTIDPKTGMNSRLFWSVDIFDQIQEYGKQNNIRTLLIGGDVFDKRGVISVPTYDAVFRKLTNLASAGWSIFSIVGNHDQALKSGRIHSLSPMPMYLIHDYGRWEEQKEIAGVSFCESPRDFLEKLKALTRYEPKIEALLIHQGINGAVIAGDEILSKDETNLADIRSIVGDATWIFSGHYHIHQKLDERCYYIGSSTPKDFGDKTEKGFLHFKNGAVKQIVSRAPKFVTIKAENLDKERQRIKGNYVQVELDKTEAVDLSSYETKGFIAVNKKVDREYNRRSSIEPEFSPLQIIRSYLSDLRRSDSIEKELTDEILNEALNAIIKGKSLEQSFGGHKIQLVFVRIENFMSYEFSEFNASDLHGLISIEGSNLDDPSAVSNGSGKSLIPEAVKWSLFGNTARGVSGDGVVNNRVGKDCMVTIHLAVDGVLVKIVRCRKHKEYKNELFFYKAGEDEEWYDCRGKSSADTQKIIEHELALDERTFDNTVYFGNNFSASFATLTDKEQKQVLENILGVEYFVELLEAAKQLAETRSSDFRDSETRISYLSERISEEKMNLRNLENDFKNFEDERSRKIRVQEKIVKEKEELIREAYNFSETEKKIFEYDTILKENALVLKEFQELKGKELDALEALNSNNSTVQERNLIYIESKIKSTKDNCIRIQNQIKEISSFSEKSLCETCGQKLQDFSKINSKLESLDEQFNSLSSEALELAKVRLEAVEALDSVRATRTQLEKDLEDIRERAKELSETNELMGLAESEKNKLEEELKSFKRASANANNEISTARGWILTFKQEINPLESQISRGKEKLEGFERELETTKEKFHWSGIWYSAYKFWECAFSDKGKPGQSPIKSFIFDSVVPILDELSRNYSEILTSGSIEVRFNTVTQIGSGELRDKFSVEVKNRFGASDYYGDSGGERRKVDLVIMFVLHALARIRSGSQFDVLFLDEILDSLDSEGCTRVMDLLSEMKKEIDKIFVITHNENLKSRFGHVINVVKEDGISKLLSS